MELAIAVGVAFVFLVLFVRAQIDAGEWKRLYEKMYQRWTDALDRAQQANVELDAETRKVTLLEQRLESLEKQEKKWLSYAISLGRAIEDAGLVIEDVPEPPTHRLVKKGKR